MRLACALLACLAGTPAQAEPVTYALSPGPAEIAFRAYGFGMLPIDGRFTRFQGRLTIDRDDPAACTIDIRAETASLQMPTQAITDDALGPDLLDVARFPQFRYNGDCAGAQVAGTLLLHGVSRPLPLPVTRAPRRWRAEGLMQRNDWGMGARPNLAGPEVRISITVILPGP